ncbi:hypothetical protein F5Y11DRAFT_348545 [Daldinia sp. FL1419]|nr:hypothetical protein F5Y11DRAFT_348545 [Daldinia sp. FL1419]
MRFLSLALALSGAAAALSRRADNSTNGVPVAKGFIIEYAPGQTDRRDGLASAEGIETIKSFDSLIFSGASIETDSYSIDKLGGMPGMLLVWPNEKVYLNPAEPKIFNSLPANLNYTTHNVTGVRCPFSKSGVYNEDIKVKPYYTFNVSRFSQDFPKIYTQVIWGSKQVRWDVYEAGWNESQWTYPPLEGDNCYIGPAASWNGEGGTFDDRYYDPNDTFTYSRTDTLHGGWDHTWFGMLGNDSQIVNGNYTWRFATPRPFGDPTVSEDWDIFNTPEISVLGHY